jgi:magnesium chelatase family protein
VHVPRVAFADLARRVNEESSAVVRARVREAQRLLVETRSAAPSRPLSRFTAEAEALLAKAASNLALSARAVCRTASVARTIAALRGRESAGREDVAEALRFRPLLGLDDGAKAR